MFSKAERRIFCFNDGVRDRKADPLRCYRLLLRETNGEHDAVYRLARRLWFGEAERPEAPPAEGGEGAEPDPKADRPPAIDAELLAAEEFLLGAARVAFGMPEWTEDSGEGEGCLDEDVQRVYLEFIRFLAKKDDRGGRSSTPSEPPPEPASPAGPSATAPTPPSS
jgi:hypothetical protein